MSDTENALEDYSEHENSDIAVQREPLQPVPTEYNSWRDPKTGILYYTMEDLWTGGCILIPFDRMIEYRE